MLRSNFTVTALGPPIYKASVSPVGGRLAAECFISHITSASPSGPLAIARSVRSHAADRGKTEDPTGQPGPAGQPLAGDAQSTQQP